MQRRASRALMKKGVSQKRQEFIRAACLNIEDIDQTLREKIRNICAEVSGDDYQALYRFLTDDNVNHNYISQVYFISETKLFKLKHDFYLRFNEIWE